jgi:hypothetical protein
MPIIQLTQGMISTHNSFKTKRGATARAELADDAAGVTPHARGLIARTRSDELAFVVNSALCKGDHNIECTVTRETSYSVAYVVELDLSRRDSAVHCSCGDTKGDGLPCIHATVAILDKSATGPASFIRNILRVSLEYVYICVCVCDAIVSISPFNCTPPPPHTPTPQPTPLTLTLSLSHTGNRRFQRYWKCESLNVVCVDFSYPNMGYSDGKCEVVSPHRYQRFAG